MAVITKLIFLTTLIMQVVMWPSVASITFACTYALVEIGHIMAILNLMCCCCCGTAAAADDDTAAAVEKGSVWSNFATPGVFLLRRKQMGVGGFMWLTFMFFYFALYAGLFVGHEAALQPDATMWLPPSKVGNYTLSANPSKNVMPVDVSSSASSEMRSNPYVWDRDIRGQAPLVVGTVPGAGAGGLALACPASGAINSSFNCFIKLLHATPPSDPQYQSRPYVPLPTPFYNVDVMITPPAGVQCKNLEVYRIVLDEDRNVVHGLDYPSSVIQAQRQRGFVNGATCGIFGTPGWCLQMSHTFSDAEYKNEIAAKCARHNGRLVLKLPSRAPDIDYETGRLSADILLVTGGADVELHAGWVGDKDTNEYMWSILWFPFKQITRSDSMQSWRESSASGDVFFKFAISVTPMFIVWYYMAVSFMDIFPTVHGQILLICVFVLLPSGLIFLSVGALVPMGGCILCVIAIHLSTEKNIQKGVLRPWLLFITAVCSSLELGWISALIYNSGYSAFYYEGTLEQLYVASDNFIITDSGSPTWTALMIPTLMVLNSFLIAGSVMCGLFEFWHARAAASR